MPIQEEVCFPRGGKESVINEKVTKKTQSFKRKRDDTPALSQKSAKKSKSVMLTALTDISLKTLAEGMVLIGCIREVNDIEIKINLPGRIIGYVPATNISTEYSEYLKQLLGGEDQEPQELQHMFKIGQFVVTKVENVSSMQDEKMKVTLTLIPEVIQCNFSISCVKKGLILPASVQSIEDHGYIMNCGITGVRAFLKKSRSSNFEEVWNDGRPLGIGQVLRCLVVKSTVSEGFSNVELNVDPQTVATAQITDVNMPLSSVIPGMCFQMIISKVTSSGLVVKFSGEHVGYIHSNYIPMNFDGEKGSELQGRVLYVEPLTKQVFFTALNNVCGPDPLPYPFKKIGKGRIFKHAKVISSKGGNVVLELKKNKAYGYVSSKHMEIDVPTDLKEDLNKIVKQKYPVESAHQCKVLEYDFMMQKYSCSLKKSVINQKYLSLDDIQPGQVVTCVVEKSTPREIKLRVGNIQGIVEPIHVTDGPVRHPDTLLQKGQKVKARVLAVKSPICEFTLKPSLVKSKNPILTEFSEAKCDVLYDGVIVSVFDKAVLVKFYGDFKTFVPAKKIENGRNGDLKKLCHVGQVVTCVVQKIDSNAQKLFMTVQLALQNQITIDDDSKECGPVKVGECYTVNVIEVSPNGLIVQEPASGITGHIPPTQLTDSPQLATVLCQTYSFGDSLESYCMKDGENTMFTKSPTLIKYFETSYGRKIVKKGLSALQENMVVVSTVVEITQDGITVSVPMQRKVCHVSVPTNQICDGTVEDALSLGIQLHQTMFVQIIGIFNDGPSLGTCRLSRVWDKTLMIENGILLLQDFLNSQKKIHNFLDTEGHSLGELQIGSRVKGTVIAVTTYGAVVDLLNGIRAVVMPLHYKGLDLEINMSVEGMVLYVDVMNQCVEITLSRDVYDIFSLLGKAPRIGKASKCLVLISRQEVVVAGIALGKNTQIVYVPSRWHINDVRPSPYYDLGERKKIKIMLYEDGVLFAVPRAVEVCVKKEKSQQNKMQISEEDSEANETVNNSMSNDVLSNFVADSEIKEEVNVKKEENKTEKTDGTLKSFESCPDDIRDSLINENENLLDHVITDATKIKKKKKNQNVIDETSKKSEQSPSVPLLSLEKEHEGEKCKIKKLKKKSDMSVSIDTIQFPDKESSEPHIDNLHESLSSELEDIPGGDKIGIREKEKKVSDKSFEKLNGIDNHKQHLLVGSIKEPVKNVDFCDSNWTEQFTSQSTLSTPNEPEMMKSKKQKKNVSESLSSNKSNFHCDDVISSETENAERLTRKDVRGINSSPTKSEISKILESSTNSVESRENNIGDQIKKPRKEKNDRTKNKSNYLDNQSNSASNKASDSKKQESKSNIQKNNIYGSKILDEDKNVQTVNNDKFLQVNAGFFWDATLDQLPNIFNQKTQDSDSNSDDEQADIAMSKKKKQRLSMTEKREIARQEEERLRKIEERLMEAEKNPQTADDFDRLVLSAPNNSQNWIKYMAYHLEATEVEKARAVGRRALKTISFREEQEKLNVWMALLNLENLFGTSESLNKTLEEAVKMNEAYKVYMQTLNMYSVTKRFEELEKIVQIVTKKYKDQKNMWIEAGMACIKCGEIEKSRKLMQHSLKVLNKRDHVEVLTRFALMENEYGEPERAETIMENILTSYPRRTDSWCVYVDMLVKSKKLDVARQVLDRAVIQKLPAMKMKTLFKKYIKFEQDHGSLKGVEKVREMAKNYVEKCDYSKS